MPISIYTRASRFSHEVLVILPVDDNAASGPLGMRSSEVTRQCQIIEAMLNVPINRGLQLRGTECT
jgi:hypothetical protein